MIPAADTSSAGSSECPEFSIIVPVFDAAEYLGECLTSAIEQRFPGRLEIIVVDDGSTDGSASIAEQFRATHPDVVTVLRQPNRGPSAARNLGLESARGAYVNFLDADDRLGRNTLRKVLRFFRRHGEAVDIVTVPIIRFDARSGEHPLNFKFVNGTRIIDVSGEPDAVLRHTTSSFIRRSALPAKPFDEQVRYGEDALLILSLLMDRPRYGVVRNGRLLKRSRSDGASLLDRLYDAPENLEQIARWHRSITDECIQRFGSLPPFVQASLLYDYQWQARSPRFGYAFRDPARRAAYMRGLRSILAHIDDDRVRRARYLTSAEKVLLLEAKGDTRTGGFDPPDVQLLFIDVGKQIVIEGRAFALRSGELAAMAGGGRVDLVRVPSLDASVLFFGEDVRRYAGFRLTLPRAPLRLEFLWSDGERSVPLAIQYGPHCGLAVQGGRRHGIVSHIRLMGSRQALAAWPVTPVRSVWGQAQYLAFLVSRVRLRQAALRLLAHCANASTAKLRPAIFLDRTGSAGDNAEDLFQYVCSHAKDSALRPVFCVSRKSGDREHLLRVGPVLSYGSLRHKIEMFRARVVVSSHANPATFNPFGRDERFLRDLLRFERVFVPHGVMNSSQCQWCSREAMNLRLFTTTARAEYEMMLSAPIGYTTEQLRLTGMPRYDRLKTTGRGETIVLMPTWRKGLIDEISRLHGVAEKKAAFAASNFAREWRAVAESSLVRRAAERHGLRIELAWHPQIHSAFRQWSRGTDLDVGAILGSEITDFPALKNESAMLVTDYSSISFDFAYLGKPVAYYQFDADRMLKDRTYHRYPPDFDFAGKGFGPVFRDQESLVRWMEATIERGMVMEEPYLSRAEAFFQFRDQDNCARVWHVITEMTAATA